MHSQHVLLNFSRLFWQALNKKSYSFVFCEGKTDIKTQNMVLVAEKYTKNKFPHKEQKSNRFLYVQMIDAMLLTTLSIIFAGFSPEHVFVNV
jgi:hypothetical protein